jgi:hypothetical protein
MSKKYKYCRPYLNDLVKDIEDEVDDLRDVLNTTPNEVIDRLSVVRGLVESLRAQFLELKGE